MGCRIYILALLLGYRQFEKYLVRMLRPLFMAFRQPNSNYAEWIAIHFELFGGTKLTRMIDDP